MRYPWQKHIDYKGDMQVKILKSVSRYLRKNPPAKPIRSPVPFHYYRLLAEEPAFAFLVATHAGLMVEFYNHAGKVVKESELVDTFFTSLKVPLKSTSARKALENFNAFLAGFIFSV